MHAECRVKRRTSQMSKSQRGKIWSGGMARMTVMRRFLLASTFSAHLKI